VRGVKNAVPLSFITRPAATGFGLNAANTGGHFLPPPLPGALSAVLRRARSQRISPRALSEASNNRTLPIHSG